MKKGYFCICMSKAVHVDLIVDLSTEGFLASLYLLVALHVAPSDLYNGSNFQRADVEELQRLFASLSLPPLKPACISVPSSRIAGSMQLSK